MQDGPKTCFGWGGGQGERRSAEKHRDLGAQNGHDHLNDEGDGNDARRETGEQQQSTQDFKAADEVCCEVRERYSQLGEAANTLVGVDELQESFPEEDSSGHNA